MLHTTESEIERSLCIHPDNEPVFTDVCSKLFASLRRADQRRRGTAYLRGLLAAPGRKTIRNIAAAVGGQAADQRLHHFICDSTWNWSPMREALARYCERTMQPRAWVVRPMLIPKTGEHSVGVGRNFSAEFGQALNSQRAIGVWAAADRHSAPVDWQLHLPQSWLADERRRERACIPEGFRPDTVGSCAIDASLWPKQHLRSPKPVVLDVPEADTRSALTRLRSAGVPAVVRIQNDLRLVVTDPRLAGHSTAPLPASQILRSAGKLRVGTARWGSGTKFVTAVEVHLPGAKGGPLVLGGTAGAGRGEPRALWISNMCERLSAAETASLADLANRVERDFGEIADQVGIRDFAGRSFAGWHRHATLASAAHVVRVRSRASRQTVRAS